MAYLTHAINNSPTICGEAGADIKAPQMLAVKFSSGKLVLPGAGDAVIGIALADQDEVKTGDPLHVQIKDQCYWLAGGAIEAGDQLKTDAEGKCVVAGAGDVVNAIALSAATSGKPCLVFICHTAIPV